jgi:hypothetical protein
MSFDWKSVVSKAAPGVATLLGGPFAGMATTALCEVFGIDAQSPDVDAQIAKAVKSMTPDQVIQMKKVDNELTAKLKEADVDLFKEEVSDKKSARDAHKDSWVPAVLTFMLVALCGVLVYFICKAAIPTENKVMFGTIVGYLFGELKQATQYWFGSTFGSQKKTTMMGAQITGAK